MSHGSSELASSKIQGGGGYIGGGGGLTTS